MRKAEEADAEAVNVGQDMGGGAVWVDEGGMEGGHCFCLNTGHWTALHLP